MSPEASRVPVAWLLGLVVATVVLHAGLVLNPGYFSHDEWQKWDHAAVIGFWDFAASYGRVQAGPEFGYPVRPLGFLQQGLSSLLMMRSPLAVHLIDVLIHAGIAVTLLLALLRCGAPRRWALLAAACFAASPLATASTGWMAASFDRWYALFILLGCAISIRAMQSGLTTARSIALLACAAAAILSKETAVVMPAAALLSILAMRSLQAEPERFPWERVLHILVLLSVPIAAFLMIRLPAIMATLEGRAVATYAPSGRYVGRNLLGYWVFPFLPHNAEFPRQSRFGLPLYLVAALLHAGIAVLLGRWTRWRLAAIYVAAYFVCLVPVLSLADPGSHYLYASGVPFSLALSFVLIEAWRRRARWLLPPLAVAVMLPLLTNFSVQARIHRDGACQSAFLESLDARLAALRAAGAPELTVTIERGTRDWVPRRAIHDRPAYDGREGGPAVRLVLNGPPAPAGSTQAVMGRDCRLR